MIPTADKHNAANAETTSHNGMGRRMTLSSLDTWTYWLTVAAIVLPVIAALAAFFALRFSSQASNIRDESLERFKADSQAKIAAADARAAEANTKSAVANERAAKLELEAAAARERAAKAEKDLLELRKSIPPRKVAITWGRGGGSGGLLGQFSGMPFAIEITPDDPEARRFAEDIAGVLNGSGWIFRGASEAEILHGVFVETKRVEANEITPEQRRAEDAAALANEYFEANGLNSKLLARFGNRAPVDTVLIRVGPKPEPTLSDERFAFFPAHARPFFESTQAYMDQQQIERIKQLRIKWGFHE
jgi:hypothetical protein